MPQDDYQPITAGTLKLKGVKPEKHKKKRKRDPSSSTAKNDVNGKTIVHEGGDVDARNEGKEEENGRRFKREKAIDKVLAEEEASKGEAQEDDDGENAQGAGKTEAERRHDERRRKRVCLSLCFKIPPSTWLAA